MDKGTTHECRRLHALVAAYERLADAEALLDGRNSEEAVDAAVGATCAAENDIVAEPVNDLIDWAIKAGWLGRFTERHAAHSVPKFLLPAMAALNADLERLLAAERYRTQPCFPASSGGGAASAGAAVLRQISCSSCSQGTSAAAPTCRTSMLQASRRDRREVPHLVWS